MKSFEDLNQKVIDWAHAKGILLNGTPIKQAMKTQEELTELCNAIIDKDKEEIADAIGDILVTVIIQARMQDMHPLKCLESAYNVISKRTGKMINGQFVKDEGNL